MLALHLTHRAGNRVWGRKILVSSTEQSSLPCLGLNSHLLLLLQLTGLSLEALQLLLGLLEFLGGALQLSGQLLVSESQLSVLSPGFLFVVV